MEACNEVCNTESDECKKTTFKKECKNTRRACRTECDAATLCALPPVCKDNNITGLGTAWCETNVQSATFCGSSEGDTKCKKTCGLCD